MKYFYLLVFLMCSAISHAQLPGFPLIDHTSEWHIYGYGTGTELQCNPPLADVRTTLSYFIQGDTTINSKNYLKMYYERADSHSCFNNSAINWVNYSAGVGGYIREIDNQIFRYNGMINDEELLYDYNTINVGDSLYHNCLVSSIDTLYLLHQPYLKYVCDCNSDFLIQGIGTKRTFFSRLGCGIGIEADWKNMCYSKNGFTIEVDTSANCISTGDSTLYILASNVIPITKYQLYPNPTSNKVNVVFDETIIDSYSIYSIDGKKLLFADSINSTELAIDISNLISGLYILKIELNNGEIIKEKIFKD